MEARLVDDGAHARQCLSAFVRDGNAEERHRPAIGPGQTEQGADQGGLPRTVRSEVAESGAPRHEKLHLIDGDGLVEALGEAAGLHCPSVALIVTEGDITSSRGSR